MKMWLVSYRSVDQDGCGSDHIRIWISHPAQVVEARRRLKAQRQIECIYSAIPIPDDLLTDEQIEALS